MLVTVQIVNINGILLDSVEKFEWASFSLVMLVVGVDH